MVEIQDRLLAPLGPSSISVVAELVSFNSTILKINWDWGLDLGIEIMDWECRLGFGIGIRDLDWGMGIGIWDWG